MTLDPQLTRVLQQVDRLLEEDRHSYDVETVPKDRLSFVIEYLRRGGDRQLDETDDQIADRLELIAKTIPFAKSPSSR